MTRAQKESKIEKKEKRYVQLRLPNKVGRMIKPLWLRILISISALKWEFSGRDIFVKQQVNESAFEMKENKICLYDFYDNYYEIDYDGKTIVDKPSDEWLRSINRK